jgi:hypothetical protein
VIGYGGGVDWALGGALAGRTLVPISELATQPLRVEQRHRLIDDGAGGLVEQTFKFPVWFEPKAAGRTPMCQAITLARDALQVFLDRFPDCFPPPVLNITDGKSTDGNPELPAYGLRRLSSRDGNVLFFNAHLSARQARPIEFPAEEAGLPEPEARLLFRMSSVLPPRLQEAARDDGLRLEPGSRGSVFNADLVAVLRFLDVGTRVGPTLR